MIGFRFSPEVEEGLTNQKTQQQLLDAAEGPPQVAKSVVVYPDGKMRWKLERAFPNSRVKDVGRLYAFKLNRELLEKKSPASFELPQQGPERGPIGVHDPA